MLYTSPLLLNTFFSLYGKIGVVILCAILILVAIFGYLWQLDKKITRIEKKEKG